MNYVLKAELPIIIAEILLILLFGIGGYFISKWLNIFTILLIIFFLFTLYFFRNPERSTPEGGNFIISPADGKIIKITEIDDDIYFKKRVKQISIFMSVFNVHVNRAPIAGTIVFKKYFPGKFFKAFDDKASLDNEQVGIAIKGNNGKIVFFKMIAGIIARRVVTIVNEGDKVRSGERVGLIKFGSRVDILVDSEIKINVKLGDKVVAGETIIGEFK